MKIRSDFVSNSSSTSFIMILEKKLSKREFIKKLGANEGSYAASLISQIYDSIMKNSDDSKEEYEKYYSKEYDTFAEYLEKRKNFKKEKIEKINEAFEKGKTVYIGDLGSDGTPIESYLCSEDFEINENGIFIDGLADGW